MSPYGLLQERLPRTEFYPWQMLVVCYLLNRTGRTQVRGVYGDFFKMFPTPRSLLEHRGALQVLLRPLGLWRRRADLLTRMSAAYVAGSAVEDLPGVGKYALDSWKIFVEGRDDVVPDDHMLRPYLTWRKRHGKMVARRGGPARRA